MTRFASFASPATLAACLLLTACGDPPPPPPVEETVFKEQVEALDRAREVEKKAGERKRELDEQLERDTGGGQE